MSPTVALAMALMAVILMMILPVPAVVLDAGLAASFALAILIFSVTLFIDRPLDFSSFPTALIASLMLRLALNVSSTKLIIGQGHTGTDAAGDVIEGVANFVMGGNAFLGLVVFGVLLIVNFIVITKGAARMAEVGARFALDGMPGRQLAIDSDLSAGAISHEEAKRRRELEQQETTFFGSLDGASKFVKGDAIAGVLITLLNLLVGLAMGIFVHGMPVADAFRTYAILTVGDGLVTQIPAVIISIAAALLLARGGTSGPTDIALFGQLGRNPSALASVAVLLGVFALVPGLPFFPFMAGALFLAGISYKVRQREAEQEATAEIADEGDAAPETPVLGDILDLDDIHIEFAPDLVSMVLDAGTGLDARISNMRTHVARTFGVILPEIRLTDQPELPAGTYVIHIQGVEQARGVLHADLVLALAPERSDALPAGKEVEEPVYGAPARWISKKDQEAAVLTGATVVTPPEILATHLFEIVRKNLSRLLTLKSLRRLLAELTNLSDPARAEANRKFLDELIPDKVQLETLHEVLRLLLEERVSIRNLPVILETIAEARQTTTQPEVLCELVRKRLSFQLVAEARDEDGRVPLLQISPRWEETFESCQVRTEAAFPVVALPPELAEKLSDQIVEHAERAAQSGVTAVVAVSSRWRRFLQSVTRARNLPNPVMSFEEIGMEARPSLIAVIAP